MKYWLMKSEPSTYSISDLKKDAKTSWSGVRNYQARNFMRDQMQVGDMVLFYHSNAEPSGVAGIAQVCSEPHADETQFDSKSDYFDSKATKEKPIWILVDIKFVKKFDDVIPLGAIKENVKLAGIMLAQKGSRLSVQPVSKDHFETIVKMSQQI